MKRGFTLIELLAVIVILAIIALIATPIVLNIIKNTRKSANDRSIELYKVAVENSVADYLLNNTSGLSGEYYTTGDGKKLYSKSNSNEILNIHYNGKAVNCSSINITTLGKINYSGCKAGVSEVATSICNAVTSATKTTGNVPTGEFTVGDEYICDVNDTTSYHFFVLSSNSDSVSLILNNSIKSDGTLGGSINDGGSQWMNKDEYESLGGTNEASGYAGNDLGPITLLNFLSAVTSKWTNIPNIIMNYTDEGTGKTPWKYGGIKTVGDQTTVTKENGTVVKNYSNLKARIGTVSEFQAIGCSSTSTCPSWVPINTSFWLLASTNGPMAMNVYRSITSSLTGEPYLVRPVIEINKANIS